MRSLQHDGDVAVARVPGQDGAGAYDRRRRGKEGGPPKGAPGRSSPKIHVLATLATHIASTAATPCITPCTRPESAC